MPEARTRSLSFVLLSLAFVVTSCRDKSSVETTVTTSASQASSVTGAKAATTASAAPPPAKGDHAGIASAFVDHLVKKEFALATKSFGPDVAKVLDASKLEDAWVKSIAKGGDARAVKSAQLLSLGAHDVVIVRVALEKGTVDSSVSFASGSDDIIGFHLDAPIVYTAPTYVDFKKYVEHDVVVGSGKASLPGTLTSPDGDGPFPAVVLVHGSGPNDRDESIGPSRPFRDLALGLACKGIAVLRYEKRTHGWLAHLDVKPEDVTIKEEYLDDVAAAVATLRGTSTIDPKRIFILGHSEGGMLTPKLLAADPTIAGGIVFSGNARRFEDLLVPQYTYLAKADDGKIGPMEQLAIDTDAAQIKKVKDPSLSEKTDPKDLPLGIAPKYWLSLRGYDPVAVARSLPQPLLLLQGGRDYQVTEADDFALWKKGLASKSNASFELYPDLNHAGIAGVGLATPQEYATIEGHVDEKLVSDVAAFVMSDLHQ